MTDRIDEAAVDPASAILVIESADARSWPLSALGSLTEAVSAQWRLPGIALLGGLAAGFVAYLTAENPDAGPPHAAPLVRVLIITMFIAAGIYARTSKIQERTGALLIAAGFFSALWLLNGSANRFAFSLGVLCSGFTPPILAYVMLAHPSGHLESRAERLLLAIAGAGLVLFWGQLILTDLQPPFRTPLLRCVPHCPENVFFVGGRATELDGIMKALTWLSWTALACGTPLLLWRRIRSASAPLRHSLLPVLLAASANGLLWVGFFAARAGGLSLAGALGAGYVEVAVVIPLAILLGLGLERLFIARELAAFVNELVGTPHADPQPLMAKALEDPSLRIAYQRPRLGTYVDSSGSPIDVPEHDPDRSVVWIERDRTAVAAVICEGRLADQGRFVQAAGAAAIMRLEGAQLEADLIASTRELAASRARLIDVANDERQRIERDLHDGVQQQLVGLRIKLDMAAEAVKEEPERGERMLETIGLQMDDLLATLRSLAKGIYPTLLAERGLAAALESTMRRSPQPIIVRARGISRYPKDVEIAVYFCCLEATQNIVKHAGRGLEGAVHLWEAPGELRFEVDDSGSGFDPAEVKPGSGLVNMRDRIEAVGGALSVISRSDHGTVIRGSVPVA
jgi:signal transduction histidine kinase